MKRLFLITVLFILFTSRMILAYEQGMLNLKTPTNLGKGQKEFKISHRFKGKISEEPFDTFFGMDQGVNVSISFRYTVWSELELKVSRIWDGKEYTTGASYAYSLPEIPIRSQIDLQFFSYREYSIEEDQFERKGGVFGLFSLQSESILKRITPVVNLGYDAYNQETF